jgi:hypothetical protein
MSKTIQAGKCVLTFGQYKGLSILAIDRIPSGRSYLQWVGRTFEDCDERRAVLEYLRVKTARERSQGSTPGKPRKPKKKGKAKPKRDESVPWRTTTYGWAGGKAPDPVARRASAEAGSPFRPGIFTMGVERPELTTADLMDPDVTDRLAAVELPEPVESLDPEREAEQIGHLASIVRSVAQCATR